MCQLLGMNCNTPTDIIFSFEGFRMRGGLTDHHVDGFGIGFFELGFNNQMQDYSHRQTPLRVSATPMIFSADYSIFGQSIPLQPG